MNLSLQDKPRSNQMADSRFPTAVISHFYSAVYLHTLVWSTPKIACSVPCVGLSFLRMSDMSRACLKRSLHRFPGSDALDSSSRNSGMSPEAIAHAPVRSKIYRNSSLLHRGSRVQAGLV